MRWLERTPTSLPACWHLFAGPGGPDAQTLALLRRDRLQKLQNLIDLPLYLPKFVFHVIQFLVEYCQVSAHPVIVKDFFMATAIPAFEKQYSPAELGNLWGFDAQTIQRWFLDEPGVFVHRGQSTLGKKRQYTTLRIPESIAARVYSRKANRG